MPAATQEDTKQIELEDQKKPVKALQRTSSPNQVEFLNKKYAELVRSGCIKQIPKSQWV